MTGRYGLITGLLMLLASFTLSAQQKRVYTTERTQLEPKIDGLLNDKCWEEGSWSGDFTQRQPNDGAPATQKTFFKILYNDDFIFVAVRALDNQSDSIDSRLIRRDNEEGDQIGVYFDSYHDLRTAFGFIVNAAGVKSDILYSNNGEKEDKDWNPIWWVKTTKDDKGWYAEMKIPLSQLRFSDKKSQVWGLEVARVIYRRDEISLWQAIPRTKSGWIYNFGELHGIYELKPKRIMEVAPYVLGGIETYEKESGNPYADGLDIIYNAGVDGKLGITNDFVLDFTFNPDFGQVEADPSEVNLTAFETYQRERRPFFIEGSNIMDYKISPGEHEGARDNLFYSRRIGRIPQYYPDLAGDEYIDFPLVTRIIGALKLTGKTRNGLSMGVMESVTREEKAQISKNGEERNINVEPLTNYFVARVQKDFNKGNTVIGGEITNTYRNIRDSSLLFLPETAGSGGLDYAQYWKGRRYYLKTTVVGSLIKGDSLAMIERQTASQRYYQRPDADYLTLDSGITNLSGHGGNLSLGKNVESGWSYDLNFSWRSPGLSLNDVGYIRNGDKMVESANLQYNFTEPKLFYRLIELRLIQWQGWDFGGNPVFSGGMFSGELQFKNMWTFVLRSSADFYMHDNSILRGGPSFYMPAKIFVRSNIETNTAKRFYMDIGFRQSWGQFNYYRRNAWDAGFTYRPFDALSVAFHPNVYATRDDLQYVDETHYTDPNGKENTRYIMARLDQMTLVFRFYVDLSITPDLSIQYFGSPFISSGTYSHFKRVNEAGAKTYADRTHEFSGKEISYDEQNEVYKIDENMDGTTDYLIGNPDFNFKQFQSNLVLRWEYTPGSVLFFVWTQNKTNEDGTGTFDFGHDMSTLFNTRADNVFMVKLSYRLFK